MIPSFISQIVKIERGEQIKLLVGNLAVKRDISDVKDVVSAYRIVMEKGETGEVYNIGSGQSVAMKDLLNRPVISQIWLRIFQKLNYWDGHRRSIVNKHCRECYTGGEHNQVVIRNNHYAEKSLYHWYYWSGRFLPG